MLPIGNLNDWSYIRSGHAHGTVLYAVQSFLTWSFAMFTVTLLTNPAMVLEAPLVNNLRNAFGGSEVQWLAPNGAAEFDLATRPRNYDQIWNNLQTEGVDMVIQPTENRRKMMLLADMDSTMIQQECIDELAAEAGVGPHVAKITARAMNGELDFEASVRERVSLLKGLPTSVVADVLKNRITFVPGGKTLLATMKANGAYTALVSGGFTSFTQKVAADLGFDENRANTLLFEYHKFTGKVAEPILGRDAKITALNEIATRLNINAADVLAVGDGANDLGMLGVAGTGVALHAKPSVQAQCDIRINHGDLTALLYLQGYRKAEFV
jgi:phosphoserine phosphatase